MNALHDQFKDYFSDQAATYARRRPHYPEVLFDWLATLTPRHELAWDCGTGNGQAARGLVRHYARIVATDPSGEQLAHAFRHARIDYRTEPAEASSLPAAAVDLVVVAQALHWFDFDRFYAEVRRVTRPGGVLAAWTYGLFQVNPAVDRVTEHFYRDVTGPYWPPERRHIDAAYTTIPFPFAPIPTPTFDLTLAWTLDDLLGFLRSWSAVQRLVRARGGDPVAAIRPAFETAWGPPQTIHTVRCPMHVLAGRILP